MINPAASTSPCMGAWMWDARPLLRQVDNDLELAAELVEMFLDEAPDMVAGIRRAARTRDAESLSSNARAFGSSAAAIGAGAWSRRAEALLQDGRTSSTQGIESRLGSFEKSVARLESQLVEALGR